MGNVLENATGGAKNDDRNTEASSSFVQDPSTSSPCHHPSREESERRQIETPYRRYPRYNRNSYFPQQNYAQSSNITTPQFFRHSCPVFAEQPSPQRKRFRSSAVTTKSVEDSLSSPNDALWSSLPPNQSPYSRYHRNRLYRSNNTSFPAPADANLPAASPASNLETVRPMADTVQSIGRSNGYQSTVQNYISVNNDVSIDDEQQKAAAKRVGGAAGGGPITKAVVRHGLKARFKSFSAWLLNEPAKETAVPFSALMPPNQLPITSNGKRPSILVASSLVNRAKIKRKRVHFQCPPSQKELKENGNFPIVSVPVTNSSSFPLGLGDSLKRWSSLRASFSFGNATKLKRATSQRSSLCTPSRSRYSTGGEGGSRSSVASLNSLTDGRTPWPVPWLEAIFLPEFPAKGSVNEKAFAIIGTIAKGAFGKVYRVSLKTNPQQIFAMKVQNKSDVITQNAIKQIKDEVTIHQTFANYPFIAQLYCTWQNRSNLYIVLQYVAGYGDLYQLWRDEGPFNEDVVRIWGAELAMAIDYMHANGVIYRDLKMENITLDDDGHVQLVDFGLAKWLYYGERTATICGTLQYMAPEVLEGKLYNHAVDWWSLGVLLHTLMVGSYPYSGGDSHTAVKIDDYVPPSSLSVEAQTLLNKLLRKDPNWRLRSFTMYKTQALFRGISFDSVKKKTLHPFDYILRMRRCNTCNIVSEGLEGFEDGDLVMFQEDYDALKSFDSLYDEGAS